MKKIYRKYAVVAVSIVAIGWAVLALWPESECMAAQRAASAFAAGKYKKYWSYMSPDLRAEFGNDRSVFIEFAKGEVDPRRGGLIGKSPQALPQDTGGSGCYVRYGEGTDAMFSSIHVVRLEEGNRVVSPGTIQLTWAINHTVAEAQEQRQKDNEWHMRSFRDFLASNEERLAELGVEVAIFRGTGVAHHRPSNAIYEYDKMLAEIAQMRATRQEQ